LLTLKEALALVRRRTWVADEPALLLGFRPLAVGERQFRTLSSDADSRAVPPLVAVLVDTGTIVAPISKRTGNPYGDFVFVGRGPTSDLVIDDPSVSKSHAAFRRGDDGSAANGGWMVKDNRSRNGTYIDGNRIVAGSWLAVGSGAQITFGGVAAYFVDAQKLATMARDEMG
jgi:hypothetical protein